MAAASQQTGRWRGCALNLGLVLVSVLATAAVIEVALRLFTAGAPPAESSLRTFTQYDPELGWRGVPAAEGPYRTADFVVQVRLNSGGWRDEEFEPAESGAGTGRILLLGDSYAWGFGVEQDEMFAARIEERGPEWNVLNLGISGYGPDQELLLLRARRDVLRPDLVLAQLSLLNDVGSVTAAEAYGLPKPFFLLRSGELELNGVPVPRLKRWDAISGTVALQQRLSESSRLYGEIRRRWRPLRLWLKGGASARPYESRKALFLKRAPTEIAAGWELTEALLAALRDEAAAGGAALVVLAVCDPLQVEDRLWRQLVAEAGPEGISAYDRDLPSRRLAQIGERLGVPVIEVAGAFRAESLAGVDLFVSDSDPHWNAAAHDLAARLVLERIGPPAVRPTSSRRSRQILKKLSTSAMSSTGVKAGSERAKATP